MNKQRPVNLNLFTIRFPIPAIVSILHRISGFILFLLIPLFLWVLSYSLSSAENFQTLHDNLTTPTAKVILWLLLAPFLFHFVAGIRHLLMDINIGVQLKSGRITAIVALIVAILLMILVGVYL